MHRLLVGQFSSTMRRVASESAKRRIVHHGDAVADALGAENFDGFAHGVRAADFSGVADDVQACVARQIEGGAEIHGGQRKLVAAHAEGDDAGTVKLGGPAGHFLGRVGAELAGGVENPGGAQAVEGDDLRRFANGGEIGFDILHAAQHHARGNGDFGVDDILAQQLFEQPAGDQGVVLGIAQKRSDPFEDVDESREVGVVVARGDFFGGELGAVARGKFDGRFRADRAFEMQVQLRLRQGVDDRLMGGPRLDDSSHRARLRDLYCDGNCGRPALIQAVIQ